MNKIKKILLEKQIKDPLIMHKACTVGGFIIGILASAVVIAASEQVVEVIGNGETKNG
jgi:hypothetical protein